MEIEKSFWREETQEKKRFFYFAPCKKPAQKPVKNGPVKRFTEEEVFLENLRRLNWKGESLA